ncbi:hypothetical protein BY996DRAFT_6468601 [Phakopsora pachyrhizi]|uniref:Uncharacterized protein n=1 Tax=Phakopsora pachyrhizi TaxID=170000 RepID=A0AAV0AJ87_PHAPC|nr:hypothetical protein BY996DRAFT_6468601 [Phakopsora pachyrhizi]CAH7667901.1 hypothetical protein PPACK8108_LOCUS2343 [Phakopsora pachyrhizi]
MKNFYQIPILMDSLSEITLKIIQQQKLIIFEVRLEKKTRAFSKNLFGLLNRNSSFSRRTSIAWSTLSTRLPSIIDGSVTDKKNPNLL